MDFATSLLPRADEELIRSPYGYVPTRYVAIIFIVLFSLSTLAHTAQASIFRTWWLFPTACLAGAVEVLGWSGRLWSSYNVGNSDAFQIQITATILAPTPLVAANFIILGRIITRLGPVYSRLSPKWYTIVFLCCDIVSLVIQGVGGGMAAVASDKNEDPTPGGNTMLGGIIFQMIAIAFYVVLALEFFMRYLWDRPIRSVAKPILGEQEATRGVLDGRLKLMSSALVFSTLVLFIRAVYRTIELSDGWDGRIITTEVYFNVLDGMMVVLAMVAINIAHPGLLLPTNHGSSYVMREKSADESTRTLS
ncbi:hypothetical protein EYR40_009863 [Pleurotus pulmonarius]|nr:hypothetical protein EYR36_004029 [Pleurotus pulmonarius]KAF4581580.1 hypothetical protein EYR38_002909 [Pleurotus pulmonarius]KAF4591260.1 hypothetical protein EYR40_009863 [Pleurotus pulmonarius]